ncbi:hypothetical protein [Pseudooceanicola nanhaiensis]|uniref:hypothetical protein n=1 Tax=Pseudooceanicola nanhaiensis TaxID=375761 RepID=UPI001CD50684|nr:hypothetical protein [Pseudooceanicola nanhaiensis]MCA0922602.1 hypothetical protein [Pseudooceanicola nanhaiensis]
MTRAVPSLRRLSAAALATAALLVAAGSSPAPKAEEEPAFSPAQGFEPFTVTPGGSYSAFPAQILDKMRAALVAQGQPATIGRPVPQDPPPAPSGH